MQRNRLEIFGYISAKPALRYLPSGTPVANVRLGESYRYQDADGNRNNTPIGTICLSMAIFLALRQRSRKVTTFSSRGQSSSASSHRRLTAFNGLSMKWSFEAAT